jgi:hypothetical protein
VTSFLEKQLSLASEIVIDNLDYLQIHIKCKDFLLSTNYELWVIMREAGYVRKPFEMKKIMNSLVILLM